MRTLPKILIVLILFLAGTISVSSQQDIFVVNVKTGYIYQATHIADADEYNPTWSPRRRLIAHDVVKGVDHDIYITHLGSGFSWPLTGADGGNDASWSPNGRYIAFDRGPKEDTSVYLVRATGGTRHLIQQDALDPDWSRNGRRIVYTASDGIRTCRINGTGVTLVHPTGENPAWSPNGRWIAFKDGDDIYKIRVTTGGIPIGSAIKITNNATGALSSQPDWSRNSQTIVTATLGTGSFDIMTVPASGGTLSLLVDLNMNDDFDPSYSRNGRKVAFSGSNSVEAPAAPPEKSLVAPVTDVDGLSNHPNPFSQSTRIVFEISQKSPVVLRIFDYNGKLLTTLLDETLTSGNYQVSWNGQTTTGTELANGVYVYQLTTNQKQVSQQMILLRN